jgi:hypothetical protein
MGGCMKSIFRFQFNSNNYALNTISKSTISNMVLCVTGSCEYVAEHDALKGNVLMKTYSR